MALVGGVRWSFRGKDAGSGHIGRYGRDRGRGLGASSAARRLSRCFAEPSYSYESTIVTGPSFASSTSIRAPNTPRATGTPSAASALQKRS